MAKEKVHLDQERKNLQSTKLQIKLDDSDSDHFPKQDKLNQKLIKLQYFYFHSMQLARRMVILLAASPTYFQVEINIFFIIYDYLHSP